MKKIIFSLLIITLLTMGISFSLNIPNEKLDNEEKKILEAQIIYKNNNPITLQDNNNIIYTISTNLNFNNWSSILIVLFASLPV